MGSKKYLMVVFVMSVAAGAACNTGVVHMDSPLTVKPLPSIDVTVDTGEKPQSKVWFHAGHWWTAPLTLASGVDEDDICVVTAFPNGDVGVVWPNQTTRNFGFRVHRAGEAPTAWTQDEMPAGASALPVGDGIADGHLNCAMASDGTLYVAVKTSYDTLGYTKIGLLVRRPPGKWDGLCHVDDRGTRPIALLNERTGTILVAYTLRDEIVYRESSLETIVFGPPKTLIKKDGARVNNVTSTKENFGDEIVILGSTATTAEGVRVR